MTNAKETTIRYLSKELNVSDKKIAELFNITRSSVCHYRKYHNIRKPETVGRIGELLAIEELNRLGHSTLDMNVSDKTTLFDILVDSKIRIEVKTSTKNKQNTFKFSLTNKEECNHIESEIRTRYKSGRTKKRYDLTADYFLLVSLDEKATFWLIPTNQIEIETQTISISKSSNRYDLYKNNFDLLRSDLNDN